MSLFSRAALLISIAGPALAAPIQCPPTLTVTETATAVPQGMQAFDAEPKHAWTNAQFSDGPPKDQAWLAPDSSKPSGKTFTNFWSFGGSPEGTWLSCSYIGTSVLLSFRLPDATKSCTVQYDSGVTPPAATAIDCR